jgi:hypothetical protein
VGGVGNWWIEMEMEKTHEALQFTKPKYNQLFKVVVILIKFLHRSYLNFTYEIIGEHIDNLVVYSWDQNF